MVQQINSVVCNFNFLVIVANSIAWRMWVRSNIDPVVFEICFRDCSRKLPVLIFRKYYKIESNARKTEQLSIKRTYYA